MPPFPLPLAAKPSMPLRPPVQDEASIRALSIARYRQRAAAYDSTCGPTWPIRERCVAALQLQPGESVLDVGCGTGLSFELLRDGVGPGGRVVGFDQSPEMLGQARQRVARAGWANVEVVEEAAQGLALDERFDALFFHYTHDILQSPTAVAALLARAKPGARVAIAGVKAFPWYLAWLNPWVYAKNRAYNGSPGGLKAPWRHIAGRLDGFRREDTQWGMGYLASGRVRPDAPGMAA